MAIYHLQAKVIQRSKGRSVVAAAAYRAAAALYDAELGRTQNFLAKTGVVYSEILLPAGAPSRWLDRETLWNEVTAVERRHDAVLAREIELSLPRELSQAEAIRLVRDFVREQSVARGMVADVNIHWGQAKDGTPQPHAHVLLTMRRIDPAGFWCGVMPARVPYLLRVRTGGREYLTEDPYAFAPALGVIVYATRENVAARVWLAEMFAKV